jgi:antitoxin VapB
MVSVIGRQVTIMSMNIKSQEAHDLARELAALTGETVTQAVTVAVRERLERLRHETAAEERIRRMTELSHSTASLMTPEFRDLDIDELLYDERGLPK